MKMSPVIASGDTPSSRVVMTRALHSEELENCAIYIGSSSAEAVARTNAGSDFD